MTRRSFRQAILAWLLILVLAVANGGLRESVLLPALGKPWALTLSGLLLSACILVVAWVLVGRMGKLTVTESLHIGVLWLVATLGFEFGFGRWVQGRRWGELLEAYTFQDGNLWPLVLVVTLFAPLLATRLRGSESGRRD